MLRSTSSSPASHICWQCQLRLASPRSAFAQRSSSKHGLVPRLVSRPPRRALHTTRPTLRPELASSPEPSPDPTLLGSREQRPTTREQLQLWDKQFGGPDETVLSAFEKHPAHGDIQNNMAKLSLSRKADEDLDQAEQQQDNEDNEDQELITIGLFLKPGDVVELSRMGREPVLAVFVQQLDFESQFYSINGNWVHALVKDITFAIPGAIDPLLLQPLIPYLPTQATKTVLPKNGLHVPRDMGSPILDMLHRLTEESERIYRINAPILDTAYSTLADETRTRMMTLSQIAKTLLANKDPGWSVSPPALLAVRKALKHNEFRFRSDQRSQRLTNVFAIRPRKDVELIETVQQWVRDYTEFEALCVKNGSDKWHNISLGAQNIRDFVAKARRLITQSRTKRHPFFGHIGPDIAHTLSKKQPGIGTLEWGEQFSTSDRQIINFLQAWSLSDQFTDSQTLHSACSSIILAVGLHNESEMRQTEQYRPAGKQAGYVLLQEIGVITPYENRHIYDESLMLPTVRSSRNLELLSTKVELTRRNPDFRDSMAGMRRDWSQTPVYCIDDVGAKEIDDGISIERVSGKPSEYWIHVHVANPTAFFDKTHVISGLAAHMTETVYMPERSFPMLPTWASQNYFSLSNNRPVITFSSRIDDAGTIFETKIQHGIIRNVISITPDELSVYMDEEIKATSKVLVVGGEAPAETQIRPVTRLKTEQIQDLRDLYAAARSLWKGRIANGGVKFSSGERPNVTVYEKPSTVGLKWMPPSVERVRRVLGDPIIQVKLAEQSNKAPIVTGINARSITEEMMLLACRSAGNWCAERGIPVMFKGTVNSPTSPYSLHEFREKVLDPYLEKYGTMSYNIEQQYLLALGRSVSHSSPIPHRVIGAEAYVKVTSPLRRFSDMIAHWQIEAAMRYEARTGQKLSAKITGGSLRSILPFSQRQMQESIITLSPKESTIMTMKKKSDEFWVTQALMRAFHFGEAPLPETFVARIRISGKAMRVKCLFGGYGGNATVVYDDTGYTLDDFQIGDFWDVKLHRIDVFKHEIYVIPVRLRWRDETVL